ncbi:MAG TPA: hypothetical protein VK484_02955, partial [Ferruginibacter sp.]|nr:hypothetical protein [Ferruginibacter sp.]
LLGVFFKRINGKGAFTAMVVGFIIGITKLTLELVQDKLSGVLYDFATINFLYFCIYLFLFSVALMIVVSLLTPKPSEEQIKGLTFATTVAEDRVASRASWNKWDVILSLFVVVIIVSVFTYFSTAGIVNSGKDTPKVEGLYASVTKENQQLRVKRVSGGHYEIYLVEGVKETSITTKPCKELELINNTLQCGKDLKIIVKEDGKLLSWNGEEYSKK